MITGLVGPGASLPLGSLEPPAPHHVTCRHCCHPVHGPPWSRAGWLCRPPAATTDSTLQAEAGQALLLKLRPHSQTRTNCFFATSNLSNILKGMQIIYTGKYKADF